MKTGNFAHTFFQKSINITKYYEKTTFQRLHATAVVDITESTNFLLRTISIRNMEQRKYTKKPTRLYLS